MSIYVAKNCVRGHVFQQTADKLMPIKLTKLRVPLPETKNVQSFLGLSDYKKATSMTRLLHGTCNFKGVEEQ